MNTHTQNRLHSKQFGLIVTARLIRLSAAFAFWATTALGSTSEAQEKTSAPAVTKTADTETPQPLTGNRLPKKLSLTGRDGQRATGWDFDNDGRPDMVQLDGPRAPGTEDRAYDFDGDGKPDFFRKIEADVRPENSTGSSANGQATPLPAEATGDK